MGLRYDADVDVWALRSLRRSRVAAVCVLVLAVGAVVTAGQNPPPTPPQEPAPLQPIFRAKTDLVRVDVSVTGRGDAPVTDLQATDFDVEEDGLPQRVETSQFIRVTGERTSDLDEPLEIRSRSHALLEAAREDVRIFAIFLDDYHIDKRPEITLPLRDALLKFVGQFGPNDLVILMEPLTTLDGLKYTRSKSEMIARIRQFEGRRGEPYPMKSAADEAQLTQRNWMELRGGVTLSALTALTTHMGGLREGRKSILFVSQGPVIGGPNSPNDERLKEALQAANRGNVTIHVLDPRPLGSVGFGGDDVLRRIAADTGGRAIVSTNDPSESLTKVIADASAYYLVGYAPTRTVNDGKFHRISVKVKRRGVDVTARRGYWAASEKELTAAAAAAAAPANTALIGALAAMSDSSGSARTVSVWMGTSRAAEGQTRFSVTWEANAANVRPGDGKPARLEVQPVDPEGKPAMDAQVIGGAPGELPMMGQFVLAPGRQRIRFTSQTASGELLDRWLQTVTIPAMAEATLALATPRFLRARSVIELRAIEANPAPAPTASNRFRPTERVLVDVECYSGAGPPPDVKVDLLNGKGDVLRALEAPTVSSGRIRLSLPVGSLAPSVYVLRIQAILGEQSAQQLVAFRVAP